MPKSATFEAFVNTNFDSWEWRTAEADPGNFPSLGWASEQKLIAAGYTKPLMLFGKFLLMNDEIDFLDHLVEITSIPKSTLENPDRSLVYAFREKKEQLFGEDA